MSPVKLTNSRTTMSKLKDLRISYKPPDFERTVTETQYYKAERNTHCRHDDRNGNVAHDFCPSTNISTRYNAAEIDTTHQPSDLINDKMSSDTESVCLHSLEVDNEILIQEVKERPALYNRIAKEYNDVSLRKVLWDESCSKIYGDAWQAMNEDQKRAKGKRV